MTRLPPWVVDNRTAVAREAAPYRAMSPDDRLQATAVACRSAARQLRSRRDRERLLAYCDPLPESTIATLKRLREGRPPTA
jgi:hypothetical protein